MSETALRRKLRLPEVKKYVPLSTSTIYALMSAGKFPRPVPLNPDGGRAVGWLESDIIAYQAKATASKAA